MQIPKMWSKILYLLGPWRAGGAQAKKPAKLGRMGCMSQEGSPGSKQIQNFWLHFQNLHDKWRQKKCQMNICGQLPLRKLTISEVWWINSENEKFEFLTYWEDNKGFTINVLLIPPHELFVCFGWFCRRWGRIVGAILRKFFVSWCTWWCFGMVHSWSRISSVIFLKSFVRCTNAHWTMGQR